MRTTTPVLAAAATAVALTACGTSETTCSVAGTAALAWEASQLEVDNAYPDRCLAFVDTAYVIAGKVIPYLQATDAAASLAMARTMPGFVDWDGDCPCGAVLYWPAGPCNQGEGHVVICNGDGTVSTSGWAGFGGDSHAEISWLSGYPECTDPAGYILP